MLIDYDLMPGNSRVWVYQSNRELNSEEVAKVRSGVERFLSTWKRHGEDLKASYTIKYNHFIVLLVDESFNDVSGCSIDASVNLVQHLENELAIDLTNKLKISFRDCQNINIVSLSDFKNFAKKEKINSNTIVFNNLVSTKTEFEKNWEVNAAQSWHHRFLV